jgi:hypothetical protein
VATFNRGEFFRSALRFFWLASKFTLNFRAIRAEYKNSMPSIMSRKFWSETYSKNGG